MLYGENESEMMKQNETESVSGMRGRFPEVPGEQPSKVMREKWACEARLRLTPIQRSVLAGKVPASLEKDSASVDLTRFPAIVAADDGSNAAAVNARDAMRAKIEIDNDKNAKYQASRLREMYPRRDRERVVYGNGEPGWVYGKDAPCEARGRGPRRYVGRRGHVQGDRDWRLNGAGDDFEEGRGRRVRKAQGAKADGWIIGRRLVEVLQ